MQLGPLSCQHFYGLIERASKKQQETPSLLMLEREVNLPIDILYNLPRQTPSNEITYMKQEYSAST